MRLSLDSCKLLTSKDYSLETSLSLSLSLSPSLSLFKIEIKIETKGMKNN
jgi:hypothetical protein